WSIWLLISIATGGAWVFYFTDAPTLARNLVTLNAPAVAYMSIAILTATTFIFGGFMREQICIYMCPWPRIQAAMMDEGTLTVGYRDWRGEPRGKHRKGARAAAASRTATAYAEESVPDVAPQGDCIDCMACVNVCPMGIDIRDGQQMECITCALCIDACDDVMDKIGKPRGLIDYLALEDVPPPDLTRVEKNIWKPRPVWQHILKPRTILYTVLWSAVGLGLLFALFVRSDIELTVSPVRNPTFVMQSDGAIRNIYDVRLRNKSGEDRAFSLSVTSDEALDMELQGESGLNVIVPADATFLQRVYVTAGRNDPAALADRTDLRIWVEDTAADTRASVATVFNGKGSQ
ncbi:MAG: cytochrome c oxidase accessory protein CcoG, partial [Sulfitobacter sp.]